MLDSFLHGLRATQLHAVLHDTLVLIGGFDDFAAFHKVVRAGLLYVHILARLASPDGRQRVPVVGRGNADGVNGLVVEYLTEILLRLYLLARLFLVLSGAFFQNDLIGVAERSQLHVAQPRKALNVVLTPAIYAQHSYAHAVISTKGTGGYNGGQREGYGHPC